MKPIPSAQAKHKEKETYRLAQFVAAHPGCTKASVDALCGSRSASYVYMLDAVEHGWVRREGATRSTRFWPTEQFAHHEAMASLALPLAKRPKVSYNPGFLGAYRPNETFYLAPSQRESLHKACPIGTFQADDKKMSQEVRRFMADLTHNSSAFEGVRINYADTISFLEENIKSLSMSPIDAVILRNHHNAIRFIVENTHYPRQMEDILVSEYDARNIHALLSDGLLRDRRKQGRLRHEHVEIRDSCYIPTDLPDTIKNEFSILINKASLIEDPYEQAVFILIHLPYLQPFEDCNKRTARLLCNIPLLNSGILPVSWSEVNQRDYTDSLLCIYEKNSTYGLCDVFVDACHRSFERFDIALHMRAPSRLEISHAREIADAIRRRILHDDTTLPRNLEPRLLAEFGAHIEDILGSIRENDMVASPYRLRPAEVKAWIEREGCEDDEQVGSDIPRG